jgi:uncharacterized membrane protein
MALNVRVETDVNANPQQVFDYLAAGEKLPEWMSDFVSVEQVSRGPATRGTVYRYVMKRGAQSTFEWSEFEPARRIAWDGERVPMMPGGWIKPDGHYELEPRNGGTRVAIVLQSGVGGTMKVMQPLMSRQMRKGTIEDAERLKAILEGHPETAPAQEEPLPTAPSGEPMIAPPEDLGHSSRLEDPAGEPPEEERQA